MSTEPSKASVSPMRRFNLLLLAFASIVLFMMLLGIDWPKLMHSFLQGVRYWPLLLVPYGLTSYFWAVSWNCLLAGTTGCPPLRRLFLLRLAGESLNQLTPTASLGGEPFKALRLHALGVAWHEATASLVIHKALMVLSLVFYILICLAMIPAALPGISPHLAWFSCLGTLLLATAGSAFVVLQRRNPCSLLVSILDRFNLCPAVLRAKAPDFAALDATLAAFYRDHTGAGLLALFFYLLGWMVHAAEVCLIFWLLGHPIGIRLALCLDALSQLVAGLGFMIPVSMGVQDGGNILLSLGFNLGSTLGAGFSILRRFREAFWLLLGLLIVIREK
jgi:glycosyltransferase 2 family protein